MSAPKLLSLVSLSSIMAGAHSIRRRDARLGRVLERNARTRAWDQTAQHEWAIYRPTTMAEALRASWAAARREAEQIIIERSETAEAARLAQISHDIAILNGRDRWLPEHYAQSIALQSAHTAAYEAARAAVQS
ncbi:MAG: hypothetical protein AB7V46_21795 [Thermomicrobiales bacterium]